MLTEATPPDAQEVPASGPAEARAVGPLRVVLLVLGFLFVGLAALGVVLPLLPTTPFLLLAAACFARSSARFYRALLGNRIFGPLIRDWREHGAIPRRAKILAITVMLSVMTATALFAIPHLAGKIALLGFGIGLSTWLWRLPTREDVEARIDRQPVVDEVRTPEPDAEIGDR
jgi:uncharacterized membrane protein YbaN (DUF454 family)